MVKCLEVFGFGPSLKGWIETFYKNISSCVINNGMCTSQFEIQRGVRQGDPMSPYLFLLLLKFSQPLLVQQIFKALKQEKRTLNLYNMLTILVCLRLILKILNVFLICYIKVKPVPDCRLTIKNRSYVDRFLSKRYSTPRANMGQYR